MELNFQQRWELIRDNVSDSSSDESKCNSRWERALTNVTRIDNTALGGDDRATDAARFQKSVKEPNTSGKSSPKKQRERRKGKEKQAVCNKKREGKAGRGRTRKNVGKTTMKSLENYTNSLVEDLKSARQDLVVWMKEQVQEIIGEEASTESERRKCSSISTENLQQQNADMFEQAQAQQRNYMLKNTKAKHRITTGQCSQVEQLSKSENNSILQHPTSLVSDIEVHHEKNFQDSDQHINRCNLLPGPKLQDFNGENMEFSKRKRSAQSSKVNSDLAIVPAKTSGKQREKTSSAPAKSKIETGPPKHQQKNIVLGIRAQSCNDILPTRASGRKRTASCQSSRIKRDLDQWQSLSSILPTEKQHKGIPSLSSEPNFSAYSTSYIASVLQSPPLPLVSTRPLNGPDPYDPTFVPNQTGFDQTALFSKLLGSSDGNRHFQTGFSNQKTAAMPVSARNIEAQHYQPINVNVPCRNQPGFDNLLQQSNDTSMPSPMMMMMMNGGVAGQNNSLSELYISNSCFLSYPPPNADVRFQFPK